MDRLCAIGFDEVPPGERICLDQMSDRMFSASNLQLLMVRGLAASWKQPYCYDLDSSTTITALNDVIVRLKEHPRVRTA